MAPSLVPSRRAPVFLLLALLLVAPLAGCLDKEDDPIDPATGGTQDKDTGTDPGTTDPDAEGEGDDLDKLKEKEKKEGSTERVPSAHFHHYWGDPPLEDAYLFQGPVTLDKEACQPDRFGEQRPPCLGAGERDIIEGHIGSATFTPENDGDDVPSNDDDAIANGKADTVLVGTNRMEVTISWQEPTVGDLLFFYKPGNTPEFQPTQPEEYIRVQNGGTFTIPVSQKAADPAHQIAVSRWAFRLVADGGPDIAEQEWPFPIKHGEGKVDVEILIFNGGKDHIAPPHPDPWQGAEVLTFEKIEGDFTTTQAKDQGVQDGAEDIKIPAVPKKPSIVPAGTDKLVVKAWVNGSLDQDAVTWGLKWHGADTVVYQAAPAPTAGDDGAMVFEIPIEEVAVDPPYESESYFRFGFYPIAGGEDEVGHYEAESYALIISAHKDPAFTYYF